MNTRIKRTNQEINVHEKYFFFIGLISKFDPELYPIRKARKNETYNVFILCLKLQITAYEDY